MPKKSMQTANGKAFEYAVSCAIEELGAIPEENEPRETGKKYYSDLNEREQINYLRAARAAIGGIRESESILHEEGNVVKMMPDSAGKNGDVRDIVIYNTNSKEELGISCKHNHSAVKHQRISPGIDIGQKWVGTPSSEKYRNTIMNIIEEIKPFKGLKWSEVDKEGIDKEALYLNCLNAVIDELWDLQRRNPEAAPNLIRYLIGREDFYKVIYDEDDSMVKFQLFNLSGTLGKHRKKRQNAIKLPTRILDIQIVPSKKISNTIKVDMDNGWCVTMRLHNASSKVESSLKFDTQLESTHRGISARELPL